MNLLKIMKKKKEDICILEGVFERKEDLLFANLSRADASSFPDSELRVCTCPSTVVLDPASFEVSCSSQEKAEMRYFLLHQFYRDMVKAYTELFPDIQSAFAPESENTYRVWDTHDKSSFLLEIKNDRLFCNKTDCIETMKSAYDNDPERLEKIQKFEEKYYR